MARGGYRPGAGRPKGAKSNKTSGKARNPRGEEPPFPPDVAAKAAAENLTPLDYMLKVMNDTTEEDKTRRDRMAIAACPFIHARPSEGKGKKQDKGERAKAAGLGKFAPSAPPLKLVK